MPIHNTDIVKNFNKVADLLEIKGANPFRIRAYRNAARTIGSLSKSVADLIAEDGPLTDFSGIGKDLAEKIEEIVKSGTLSQLKALEKDLSPGLHDLLQIPELGPKKVKALYEELGIDDLSSLKKAAQNQKIRNLDHMRLRIHQARRAWLEADDVLNTCSWQELKKILQRT